ncbi:MAG TPA: twin-arginine translocase TatA/TatE family subunit [Dehalococcoidia bacterium]|nr:twin-arginine translocase TatA/TatE family subunit [Dehalococcoidia bacterium]
MGPELFGVGAAEAALVFVIALVLVGPQRFPDLARQSGRWYRIARRYTADITKDVRSAIDEIEEEVRAETEDLKVVRELGEDMETQLKETSADLDAIGDETKDAAEVAPTTNSTPAPTSTAPAPEEPVSPYRQSAAPVVSSAASPPSEAVAASDSAAVADESPTTPPAATES